MTNSEKQNYLTAFPNMDVDRQPRVTAERSDVYNCIAWSVGLTNTWINPFQSLNRWDLFYAIFHLERSDDDGTVALWKHGAEYTHACRAAAQQGFNWESKCGPDLRILHELDEMTGETYGAVFTYYRPEAGALVAKSVKAPVIAVNLAEQSATIQKLTQDVPAPVRETFEALFATWKTSWFAGPLAFSSDTRAFAQGYAFDKLLDMGSEILPLVVEKLADPDNFVALQLYDDLQPDEALRIEHKLTDPVIATGEQGRAQQTVSAFLARQR